MALDGDLRALWLFQNSLIDEVSNNDFVISSGNPEFVPFERYNLVSDTTETRYGIKFTDQYYFRSSSGGLINLQNLGAMNFVISFWWYSPGAVGYTKHAITRKPTSRISPIFGIGETFIDPDKGTEEIIEGSGSGSGEIIITEVAASKTHNSIRLEICEDNNAPTHRIESLSYLPGLHHILISYQTSSTDDASLVKIFVDGRLSITQPGPSRDVVSPTGSYAYLNTLYHGYSSHKYTQNGSYISDLIVRGGPDVDDVFAEKIYQFGHESITESGQHNVRHSYFGVSYDQPSTVTTRQIYAEGGSIYVARTNGNILKGERPIWDNDFRYPTDESLNHLTISDRSKATKIASGIKLSGTTIKV